MTFIATTVIRVLFIGAVIWMLVAAVRRARRSLGGIEAKLVFATASAALFIFAAKLVPLFLVAMIIEWYDFEREVTPHWINGFDAQVRIICLLSAFVLVLTAACLPTLGTRRRIGRQAEQR